MDIQLHQQARQAISRLLRPLVRLLLRYGIEFEEFANVAKQHYVSIAQAEFSLTRRPASKSRIALLTGLNRREVARLLDATANKPDSSPGLGPVGRIVAAWVREPAFHTSDGRPSLLAVEGSRLSLEALSRHCAADIPVKTILRELLNQGLVAEHADGRLELLREGYLPTASEGDKLHLLGTDVAALIGTIDHNLQRPDQARFQRKVSFDHLSDEGLSLLQELLADRGQQLLLELDQALAPYNQPGGGSFAGLGLYQIQESAPPAAGDDHAKS